MDGSEKADNLVTFQGFELNLQTGELRKGGTRIRLQDQPFKVLAALLQHPGQVVTREELRKLIWPDQDFGDFDHAINLAVTKLRSALGDSADIPHLIETLPRRGYRFIALVEPTVDRPPQGRGAQWAKHHQRKIVAGTLGLIVIVLAGFIISRIKERERSITRIQSIAVLPLENLSRDPEQEFFADGMTDALISNLSRIGSLRIISRTSAMHYKGTRKTLPEISKELNVDAIVEGSVMRSGNRVRITAQLIRAPVDQQIWSESYERDLGDVLKLQNEVAEAIAGRIRSQLPSLQQIRPLSEVGVNPEAYEAYLKGRFYWSTNSAQPGIKKAQGYFEEAIQTDPNFAPAYVGLADSYVTLGSQRWLPPEDAYRHAKEAIQKAVELNPSVGEVHRTLGWLSWRHDWDWKTAEKEFRYAIQLNPNDAVAHAQLGLFLAWSGRRAEALAEHVKGRELDPASPLFDDSIIYYHFREYQTMLKASQNYVASNPDDWLAHYFLAVAYDGLGRHLEATAEYQKAVDLTDGDSDPLAGLAHAFAMIGRRSEAQKILFELQKKATSGYVSPYMIATIYAGLGQKDKAFDFLKKAQQERSPDIPYFLMVDLRLDDLRLDARFQDLMKNMRFPR